jgi:twinkle protein
MNEWVAQLSSRFHEFKQAHSSSVINLRTAKALGLTVPPNTYPGHGKTQLWAQIWYNVARTHDVTICVASFETRPKPHLRRTLRTLHSGCLERDMSPEQIAAADGWIRQHYLFLQHPDHRPTLGWLLDRAEVSVIRHGAKVVQVDPWNRLEGDRAASETETDYIGRCLRELDSFAHDMHCHGQILAHPSKDGSGPTQHGALP